MRLWHICVLIQCVELQKNGISIIYVAAQDMINLQAVWTYVSKI